MFAKYAPALTHRAPSIQERRDLFRSPDVIGHARRHRGRRVLAERAVGLQEVVSHEVQADHRRVVLDLLGEPIRQPREAPHAHPHGQVLPLDIRRAYQ